MRGLDESPGEDLCALGADWQAGLVLKEIRREMRSQGLSIHSLAQQLDLSAAATRRLLEGRGQGCDLLMLHRMAAAVDKTLTLSLF